MFVVLLFILSLCWRQATAENLTLSDIIAQTPKCAVRNFPINFWFSRLLIRFTASLRPKQYTCNCSRRCTHSIQRIMLKHYTIIQRLDMRTNLVLLARPSQYFKSWEQVVRWLPYGIAKQSSDSSGCCSVRCYIPNRGAEVIHAMDY